MMNFSSAGFTTAEIHSIMTFVGPHTCKQSTSALFQDILLNTVVYIKVISQSFLSHQDKVPGCVYFSDRLVPWQSQICGLYHLPS